MMKVIVKRKKCLISTGSLAPSLLFLVVFIGAPGLATGGEDRENKGAPVPFEGPVPRAKCGPNDRVETGLQGQTTLAERLSGDSETAYNCNLELVGQFQGEGTKWQMAAFQDCAYYGQWNNFDQPLTTNPGVPVVDASDPRNPVLANVLTDRASQDPHESLKVNNKRKLLGATKGPGFGSTEATDRQFAFYDISSDCAHPKLLSDVDVPGHVGHAGDWAPDGLTYYGQNIRLDSEIAPPQITAMDVSDPTQPKLLGFIPHHTHDLSVSEDGTRMYLAHAGNYIPFGFPNPNGLIILDVSDFQFRRPNPQAKVISELFWQDGGVAQQTIPVTYRGRPHLVFTDETGAGPLFPTAFAARVAACALALPPFGFARIIDISDERSPQVVGKLKLEAHDPANCLQTLFDFPLETADRDFYGYSSHYCTVDRSNDPRLMACGYLGAGLRVFDVRDPFHPREIAYYKPPARRTQYRPGSAMWADYGGDSGIDNPDRTTDRVQTKMRFNENKGELHIWFVGQDNGFQIVRFTRPIRELLGEDRDDDNND